MLIVVIFSLLTNNYYYSLGEALSIFLMFSSDAQQEDNNNKLNALQCPVRVVSNFLGTEELRTIQVDSHFDSTNYGG